VTGPDVPEEGGQDLFRSEIPGVPGAGAGGASLVPHVTGHAKSRALPERQPARALTAMLVYLVVVGAAVAPLLLIFGGALGGLLIVAWASLLTVPVALVAPRSAAPAGPPRDEGPVLTRHTPPS
jgi:hypothetical protein